MERNGRRQLQHGPEQRELQEHQSQLRQRRLRSRERPDRDCSEGGDHHGGRQEQDLRRDGSRADLQHRRPGRHRYGSRHGETRRRRHQRRAERRNLHDQRDRSKGSELHLHGGARNADHQPEEHYGYRERQGEGLRRDGSGTERHSHRPGGGRQQRPDQVHFEPYGRRGRG